jgi:XTP/dITP diphosphohydrolase
MKTILVATTNQHKLKEYSEMLEPLGYTIKSLADFPDIKDITETEDTFRGNALIKAKTLSDWTKLEVVADDSGLCVLALDGRPGVKSARYASDNATYAENNSKLLQEMNKVVQRKAYFITVICLYIPNQKPQFFEGRLDGSIATKAKGNHGFGYDPLFVLPDGRHLAELPIDEKNKISHRAQALSKLMNYLQ